MLKGPARCHYRAELISNVNAIHVVVVLVNRLWYPQPFAHSGAKYRTNDCSVCKRLGGPASISKGSIVHYIDNDDPEYSVVILPSKREYIIDYNSKQAIPSKRPVIIFK